MDTSVVIQEFYDQDVRVMHNISTYYNMPHPHFHDGFEINFTLTAGILFNIDNRQYVTRVGSVLLINNEEIHHNIVPSGLLYDRYIFYLRPEFMQNFNGQGEELLRLFVNRPEHFENCLYLNQNQIIKMTQLMDQLHEYTNEDVYAKQFRKQLVTAQILLLCNEIALGQPRGGANPIRNERVRSIALYIQEHYSEDLTLDRLCQQFFISKSHLITSFKNTTGMTPNEYIITVRIMKSREYLKSGVSVVKTCELIGYNDESHFIRTFKRIVGITPKQYGKLYAE